ncbi:MAG: tetratricopeptide repeat protein [Armatimonadetes bacterium]|nr:tetratricopeptide repeat protein [Armatimonadota bacterium]
MVTLVRVGNPAPYDAVITAVTFAVESAQAVRIIRPSAGVVGIIATTNTGFTDFNLPGRPAEERADPQPAARPAAGASPPPQNRFGGTSIWSPDAYDIVRAGGEGVGPPIPGVANDPLLPFGPFGDQGPAEGTQQPPVPGDADIMEPPKQEPDVPDRGTVVITVRDGGPFGGGGDPGSVSDNVYRVAQNKMAQGDYEGAARDFLKALEGSKKPALIHQLLARCYKRLNEIEKAKDHFQKALVLYEAAAQAGSEAAETAAQACRRELNALGG